eukprot:scaffold7190_cov96-Cylindrotheca_fusiformis.AAC.1
MRSILLYGQDISGCRVRPHRTRLLRVHSTMEPLSASMTGYTGVRRKMTDCGVATRSVFG